MQKSEFAIDVNNICKTIKKAMIVDHLTLQIRKGEIFGFLGPNGSGKTTTMRILCGLLRPCSGNGYCLGYNLITEAEEIKRNIGYMSQYFGLYNNLTVYENLKLMAELYGLINREKIIENTLDEFELGKFKNYLAGNLSGGWKQKLSLAAALIHRPSLLLLDEPTASIDVQSRRIFWELMHNLSERGITIMFTSHVTEEIEHADRISYLYQGKLLMHGTLDEIIQSVPLTAWQVKGPNLLLLARQLRRIASVEQVISFPTSLRILGQDQIALKNDLAIYLNNPNYEWTEVTPVIEDIFIFYAKKYEKDYKKW